MVEIVEQGIYIKNFLSQTLWLLPQKAIYWQEQKILLIADVHFGKINHFRKAGIPLPIQAIYKNIENLTKACEGCEVDKIIFLGDLFHSGYNSEWQVFKDWRQKFQHIPIELIRGNHDVIANKYYKEADIQVYENQKVMYPFILSHQPIQNTENNLYMLAGHIHPAVQLNGVGKQILRMPCFYFGENAAVLPSFGNFTGSFIIKPKAGEGVYVIANNSVLKLSTDKK